MPKLPLVDFRTMDKVLHYLDFVATRQKGSHVFYRHEDGRTTTVPNHPGRDLPRPLIRKILRDVGISPDQFTAILDEI